MKQLPDTSHAAKAAFTDVMKQTHYDKIVKALKVLGKANYEKISIFMGMKDRNQVSRRLKEMMPPDEDNPKGLNMVFKPGTKSATTSGREAYDYCLTNNHPKTEPKPISEKQTNITTDSKNTVIQKELF